MISNEISSWRVPLGLAVIVGLGLSAVSLPAIDEGEPGVSLRGAEAAPQLQLGDEGAVPATKADAPLVVADNQGLKNNRTWSPNSYKNNNWNKNWNKNWNGNWNNNAYWNKKYPNKHWNKNRVYVRTWKPSTASSSAASFWARF